MEYYDIKLELDRDVIINIITLCEGRFRPLRDAMDTLYDQMFEDDNLKGKERFLDQLTNEQLIEFLKIIKY